jgi:hypothetical protein
VEIRLCDFFPFFCWHVLRPTWQYAWMSPCLNCWLPKLLIHPNCWYAPTVDTPQLLIRPTCRFSPTVDTPYPLIFQFFCQAVHIDMSCPLIHPFYWYTFSVDMPFPSVTLSVDTPYPLDAKKLQRTSLLSAGLFQSFFNIRGIMRIIF